ncbi:hypothetical protein FJY94_00050 [Candidatus Kaiserbacteria bacterium]|nr:hypothetical protein [Candidatus Kaiserbacteria bacterium]
MGLDSSFGKKIEKIARAAMLGTALATGAPAPEAPAQTQYSEDGRANIIGEGNTVNRGGEYVIETPGGNRVITDDPNYRPNIVDKKVHFPKGFPFDQ